ncbi:MAG: protein kinase [Archangium sp.]|nr:protein kinase [Archangium sp.]
MKDVHLLRKVAVGSAVDAFLGKVKAGTVLVQLSHPEVTADPELYGRFLDTTRSAARQHRHPAVLSVEETHCEDDGRFVMITAPVSGRTAADYLRENGPLSGKEARRWALRVCDALEFLHDHHVVHGHLAPKNLFLDGDRDQPDVRLLDTALLLFRGTRSVPVGQVLVAPEYLSPERCAGQRATQACDLYGMGVLMHELLTGDPPFTAQRNADRTRTMHMVSPLPPLFPGLEEWEPVLRGCLAKNANDRWSLRKLREALMKLVPLETPAIVSEPGVEPPEFEPAEVAAVQAWGEGDEPLGGELLAVTAPAEREDSATALDDALQAALDEMMGEENAARRVGSAGPQPRKATLVRPVRRLEPQLPPPLPPDFEDEEAEVTEAISIEDQAEAMRLHARAQMKAQRSSETQELPPVPHQPIPEKTGVVQPAKRPAYSLDPEPGDILGKYRLDRLLGEGGMGFVFEATNLGIRRKVALKLLRRELARDVAQVRRFVAEAQAVNRVKHPNIIQVEDLVNEPERVYFVMELLQGDSLKVVARESPVELTRIVRWMHQAADALAAAHGVGVIHRDLKPDNLMLVKDEHGAEQLKVLDFGVARIRGLDPSQAYKTVTGQVVGTPLWMAPEQVLGQEVDPRADVYSLAMVMYVLMTRKFPFAGELSEVIMGRLAREAKPIGLHTFLGEAIPKKLQQLIASGLARDRNGRPASMGHFAKALGVIEQELGMPRQFSDGDAGRSWWNRWRS